MRCKGALGATVLLVLCAAGCTDSDVLSTGNSDVILQIEVVNAANRYDLRAEVSISQLNLRPNDPTTDQSLGAAPIGIIATAEQVVRVNFNNLTNPPPTVLILSSGSWRLNLLQLNNPLFFDTNPPPPTACDKLGFYQFTGTINYTAADLGPTANFNVAPGAPPIRIQIDGAAMIEAFEDSFACVIPPGFATTFNMAYFKSKASTYIRVVQ
jgi:hypothetical protein